ncbi:TraX family protein [Paenibacillus chartarius]|uniref:TraX family protein n=1 Tax=Paenibacillus chartarius TaxID=747481 RepID=A0ABV6DE49_9BACL
MQLIAMATMALDHIGKLFFPSELIWQYAGRMAFPIYCYFVVLGYQRTRNIRNYMLRLLAIGAASQIPYMLTFNTWGINVIGTLLAGLSTMILMDRIKQAQAQVLLAAAVGLLLDVLDFDYGSYGLLLIFIYRYTTSHRMVGLHMLLNFAYLFYKGESWTIQLASVIPTFVLACTPSIPKALNRIAVPRWLWRSFYPVHFIILFIIVFMLK